MDTDLLGGKDHGRSPDARNGCFGKAVCRRKGEQVVGEGGDKDSRFGEGQSAGDLGSEVVCGEVSGENIVEVREGGGKEIIAVAGGERERVGKCKSAYKFYGIDAVVGKERLIGGEKDGVADGGNGIFKDVAG